MGMFRTTVTMLGLIGAFTGPAAAAEMSLIAQEVKTTHYRLELQIGPTEMMFTAGEAAAKHPTEGEVMVSGKMSTAMGGMSMDMGDSRHLEVHVYALTDGKVVTNAKVAIAVTDTSLKKVDEVTIAKMYGIKEGISDTHYGNNVSLAPGSYSIAVTVNGEQAEFTVAIPAS